MTFYLYDTFSSGHCHKAALPNYAVGVRSFSDQKGFWLSQNEGCQEFCVYIGGLKIENVMSGIVILMKDLSVPGFCLLVYTAGVFSQANHCMNASMCLNVNGF